jgi:hypothetical protein
MSDRASVPGCQSPARCGSSAGESPPPSARQSAPAAEGRNDLPLGDCPWRVAPPKAPFRYPSGCKETESMPLVKHTPMVLAMSRRDWTNRVNLY